jgi:hypothetical protein
MDTLKGLEGFSDFEGRSEDEGEDEEEEEDSDGDAAGKPAFACSLCPEKKLISQQDVDQHLNSKFHKRRENASQKEAKKTEKGLTAEQIEKRKATNKRKQDARFERKKAAKKADKPAEPEAASSKKRKTPANAGSNVTMPPEFAAQLSKSNKKEKSGVKAITSEKTKKAKAAPEVQAPVAAARPKSAKKTKTSKK